MIGPIERLLARIERALQSRTMPWLLGAATALLFGWLMGSLNPTPWVYDEAAYLLQAKIFASGHWAAAGRPLPEFFEQLHVLVTPRLVPKYPPGHAILLVPGIWLGAAGLIPLLWSGVTGALVFGFARALGNGWIGLLTWAIWVTAPVELYIRPSYMSQTSTTIIWLLAWWCLARWRRPGKNRWLVAVGALSAIGIVTRPVTAAAFLVPVALVVLREARRRAAWSGVILAVGLALPIVGIVPLWSYAASGRVMPTPYSEYSRVYAPWNMPGFSVDRSPPERPEIPAIARFRAEWLPMHEAHTVTRLPAIVLTRLGGIAETFWGDGEVPRHGGLPPLRWLLLGAAILGLSGPPREVRAVLWGGVALFAGMLWLASRPLWTVYYLEVFPALAFVTARGGWRAAEWLAARIGPRSLSASAFAMAGLLVAVPGSTERLLRARQQQIDLRTVPDELRRAIDSIPGRAMIFVASGPRHRPFESYVTNEPDLEGTRVWVVHDRGDDNRRLLELAPDRTPYVYDPGSGSLRHYAER